ncbi:MAG: LysM peptidoglycan-binding domain-containing protein [Patescibacteria group bacterium]|nr:LysM peptidoglycan-binding domain-containing protein [Patescibacteria group bacterium]
MPRRVKQTKKTRVAKTPIVAPEHSQKWFRLGESYSSFMMGIIVVVIAILFLGSLAKLRHVQQVTSTSIVNQTAVEKALDETQGQHTTPSQSNMKAYTVQEGDSLWSIAEKVYNSGYNWVDIAKANNLGNPDVLFAGTTLTLPQVTPAPQTVTPTPTPVASGTAIKTTTYIVVSGDTLWDIAVRAYADGYRWTDIAKANNLANPDLIFSGNILKLPR